MAKTAKGKPSKTASKATGLSKTTVKSADLAELFGVTARRIQQLTKDGILKSERVANENIYQLAQAVKQYVTYIGERSGGKSDDKSMLEQEKLRVEIDFKESKAKMVRFELQELEGQYHRSEDVAAAVADLVVHVRQSLLAMPARVSASVATAANAKAAANILADEVNNILLNLSDFEYKPDYYKQKARSRKGWENDDEDDAECD